METDIPEVVVVSNQRSDDWICHNDGEHQLNSACSSSYQLRSRPPCDTEDGGVHVYVHPDNLSMHGEESEEEVKLHIE